MSYFGTDGIRCKADLLTTEFIARRAATKSSSKSSTSKSTKILSGGVVAWE